MPKNPKFTANDEIGQLGEAFKQMLAAMDATTRKFTFSRQALREERDLLEVPPSASRAT